MVWFLHFILEPPVTFTKPLQDVSVVEKEIAEFSCEVNKPTAKVVWMKGSQEIKDSPTVEIIAEGRSRKLIILRASVDDEDEYICQTGVIKTKCSLSIAGKIINFNSV